MEVAHFALLLLLQLLNVAANTAPPSGHSWNQDRDINSKQVEQKMNVTSNDEVSERKEIKIITLKSLTKNTLDIFAFRVAVRL